MKFLSSPLPVFVLILVLSGITANAQKRQKDIQETNLFLSKPVRIDGKLNDWQDTLVAFNRTALLGYTIANDEKNIYLAIKSSDFINTARILSAGLTFTINTYSRKKEDEGYKITFPVSKTVTRSAGERASGLSANQRGQGGFNGQRQFGRDERSQTQRRALDSAVVERRKSQLAQFKEIKVHGFSEIPDSLISIYNEYGIKVAAGYDDKGSYVYELAVPLKLLQLTANSKKDLAYNIKINGRSFSGRTSGPSRSEDISRRNSSDRDGYRGNEERSSAFTTFTQAVDFWGKYSIAQQL